MNCSSASRSKRSVFGIAGIGLRFAGVQISDAVHGQSGQIGDEYAFSAGDGYGKRANGGRLIDDE